MSKPILQNATPLEVMSAIQSERGYQNYRWPSSAHKEHSLEEWFMYMEDYINEAKHLLSRESYDTCGVKALDIMRKVTAMGVAAMEYHGAPRRPGF